MPRTLIIPDIHEDIDRLKFIMGSEYRPECEDKIVFLGDWMDTFLYEKDPYLASVKREEMLLWLASEIDHPDFTFLYGNHDIQYIFPHSAARCSGFRDDTLAAIVGAGDLREKIEGKFKLWHKVGPWVCSHAGFYSEILPSRDVQTQDAYRLSREVGPARGGYMGKQCGGPLWMDWNYEFSPVDGLMQVVGHTVQKKPSWKDANVCIDTGLQYIAAIEGDGSLYTIRV